MFELYKERDLSANISDTVTFFKSFGKHFFKNFFIINGVFLLILVVLIYFISKIYMEVLFSSTGANPNPNYLSDYLNNNIFLVFGGFIATTILVLILSMLNITFPVVYLKLFEKNNTADFSTTEIISELKSNIGKMILFLLGIVFVVTPLVFLIFGFLVVLSFILIGIPMLMIAFFALFAWIMLSYHDYILNDVGFFKALSNGYYLIKLKFWTIVGSTFLMIMLVQIIQGVITIIPYMFTLGSMFVTTQNLQDASSSADTFSTMGILMALIMVFSVLLSYIFNNFLVVNQGLIYYSLHEETENHTTKSQIDLIGTDFE